MTVSSPEQLPTRRDRRRARTETTILDAAERLIDAHGFKGMTIDGLSDEADVAIGTIYARFGGKAGVYVALADRAVQRNREYVDAALATDGSPLDVVIALVESYERFHLDHPLAFRLVGLADLDDADPADRKRVDSALGAMLGDMVGAIDAAMKAGALRADDPLRVARVLWASANGVLALQARGGITRAELPRTLALQRQILLQGITP